MNISICLFNAIIFDNINFLDFKIFKKLKVEREHWHPYAPNSCPIYWCKFSCQKETTTGKK
jgi:hypothetical protein